MKSKMSISVNEEKIKKIEKYVKQGIFRNKSHVIEHALDFLLKNLENKNE